MLNGALLAGALCMVCLTSVPAQEKSRLDSLYDELDELFATDSLGNDLFALTDSLLRIMDRGFHSISLRGSYTSEVLTSGRDLGFSQRGWITGLSYYHPVGFYGEITGYLNSEYSPQYYLTDLGVGYIHDTDHWLLQAGHNFQVFDESVNWLFNKNVQASAYYQRRYWEAGLDYRFMYGRETAHRITSTAASRLSWKTGWIDKISLIPSVAVQWGNANIIFYRQSDTPIADLYAIILEDPSYPDLDRETLRRLAYLLYRERYFRATQLLRENGYSRQDVNNLLEDYQFSRYGESNAFGLMNLSLSLGASLSKGPLNLYINYTYNFPQSLPGEEFSYEENDYLSLSLFYTILWPGNK